MQECRPKVMSETLFQSGFRFVVRKKMIRAADAKEEEMGNLLRERPARPNQIILDRHRLRLGTTPHIVVCCIKTVNQRKLFFAGFLLGTAGNEREHTRLQGSSLNN